MTGKNENEIKTIRLNVKLFNQNKSRVQYDICVRSEIYIMYSEQAAKRAMPWNLENVGSSRHLEIPADEDEGLILSDWVQERAKQARAKPPCTT